MENSNSFPPFFSWDGRDGLHLTPRGNRVLFEEVVFALKDANLSLEALPADLPLFGDMDPDNPAKSFEDQDESAESKDEENGKLQFRDWQLARQHN